MSFLFSHRTLISLQLHYIIKAVHLAKVQNSCGRNGTIDVDFTRRALSDNGWLFSERKLLDQMCAAFDSVLEIYFFLKDALRQREPVSFFNGSGKNVEK